MLNNINKILKTWTKDHGWQAVLVYLAQLSLCASKLSVKVKGEVNLPYRDTLKDSRDPSSSQGENKQEIQWSLRWYSIHRMTRVNTHLSIITVSINGLCLLIRKYRLADYIGKWDSPFCWPQEAYLTIKNRHCLGISRMERALHADGVANKYIDSSGQTEETSATARQKR